MFKEQEKYVIADIIVNYLLITLITYYCFCTFKAYFLFQTSRSTEMKLYIRVAGAFLLALLSFSTFGFCNK